MYHHFFRNMCLTGICVLSILLSSCSKDAPASGSADADTSVQTVQAPGNSDAPSKESGAVISGTNSSQEPSDISTSESRNTQETKETEPSSAEGGLNGNKYYMILTLDNEKNTIGGTETIVVQNNSGDTWNELCFRDYPSLFAKGKGSGYNTDGSITDIQNVKDLTNDADMTVTRSGDDVSVVYAALSVPLQAGETRIIQLSFTAYVPELESRYGYKDGVYNLANFYPVLSVYENGGWSTEPYFLWGECFYSTVSDYKVTLYAPEEYQIISSGLSSIYSQSGDQAKWVITAAKVRDFAMVAGDGFDVKSEQADGITINCYYRNNDDSWGSDALAAGVDAVNVFNETFGEYPYPELDIVQTHLDAGGMEYPTIVMISDSLNSHFDKSSTVRIVVVHEIGHQWFYGLVGDNQYTEAWLDESFASFCELVYEETYTDEEDIQAEVDALEASLESGGIQDAKDQYYVNKAYNEFSSDTEYTHTVYTRGEIFLYQLREAMGRELFNSAMKEYVAWYSFRIAATEDFKEVITKYAGDNEAVTALLVKYLRPV